MKRKILLALAVCMAMLSAAQAEIIPYFDFSEDTGEATMQLIEDFQIPLAGPSETPAKATETPKPTATPTPTPSPSPSPSPTPTPTPVPPDFPQEAMVALEGEGIDPWEVVDLDKWWLEAATGETCAVEVDDCVLVDGVFYRVIAECPPFEKSAGMTSTDLTTLISFMAGMFARVYPV